MGGLRLDSAEALKSGGGRGPAIIPGNAARSLLMTAVRYDDEQLAMPPTGKLADIEIEAVARWVEMGAPWGSAPSAETSQGHAYWSFVPPAEPSVPIATDEVWVQSPIDAFVLDQLWKKRAHARPAGRINAR